MRIVKFVHHFLLINGKIDHQMLFLFSDLSKLSDDQTDGDISHESSNETNSTHDIYNSTSPTTPKNDAQVNELSSPAIETNTIEKFLGLKRNLRSAKKNRMENDLKQIGTCRSLIFSPPPTQTKNDSQIYQFVSPETPTNSFKGKLTTY